MTHEYNPRGKKDMAVTTDSLKSLEDNVISNINSLRDNFNSLKDVIIKRLQEDNVIVTDTDKMWLFRKKLDVLQPSLDNLEQYETI